MSASIFNLIQTVCGSSLADFLFIDFDENDDGSSGGVIINDFSRFTKKPKTEEKDSDEEMSLLG